MNWHIIKTIAKKEIITNIKNYWVVLVALVSYVLNYGVINFSVSFGGFENQGNPHAIMLSLIHLQMYVLPLFALVISYDGMLNEREQGTLDLLLSFPLKSSDIVLGKWLGYSTVLLIAIVIGFIPITYSLLASGVSIGTLLLFLLYSVWLGLTFTSLGLFLSYLSKDKTLVIAMCIILWVFLVFVFDVGFVFLAIYFNGVVQNDALNWVLLLNPVDVFRLTSLLTFMPEAATKFYGLNVGILRLGYLFVFMFLWTLIPLFITMRGNFITGRGVRYDNG